MLALNPRLDFIPASYDDARGRLVAAITRLGWNHETRPLSVDGPNGAKLYFDVAVSTPAGASPTLVLSSGLHGVEGFLGSAVQLRQLEHWARNAPPQGVRVVMLHALNPYGYAWLRRWDEGNRDPNRSFLLPGDETSQSDSDLYSRLDPFLNPKSPPSNWEPFMARALYHVLRYGFGPLQNAIASGQYEFPKGLFFGGNGPSELQQILTKELPVWLAGSSRVVHLDFHTGLGKWSKLMMLLDSPLSASQRQDLDDWWSPGAYREPRSDRKVYEATGSFGRWCCATANIHDYIFAVAEFGTYNPLHMLRVLRAENRSHHWGKTPKRRPSESASCADSGELLAESKVKADLVEAFCPRSPKWRAQVLARAFDLVERTVEGLR